MKTKAFFTVVVAGLTLAGLTAMAAFAEDVVKVTVDNYVRAETDYQVKTYVEGLGCFGKFIHGRKPYDVDNQVTVRANRDTLYSFGVFDLTSPVTITLPDPKGRYLSLMAHQSGSFHNRLLQSQESHADQGHDRNALCLPGDSDLYGSK